MAALWFDEEYEPMVDMLREAGLGGGGTETERYLRIAMLRFLLLQTHDWTDEIAERLAGRGEVPERGRGEGHDDPPDPQRDCATRRPVQNVHAMRAEVRADYEAALAWSQGDDAFAVRFERFFTELRDPLVALYGDDAAVRGRVGAAAARRSRRPPPSARASCGCSTTSARSRRTGSSASRRSAT